MKLKIELSTDARPSFVEAFVAAIVLFFLYHLSDIFELARVQ